MTGIIERDACWATTCFMNKSIRKIIAFSLKNKYFILFVTALLIIYGIITFRNMSIEAFPGCHEYRNYYHYAVAGQKRRRSGKICDHPY